MSPLEYKNKNALDSILKFDESYTTPKNIISAKELADSYYTQYLKEALEDASTEEQRKQIQNLIDEGPKDFDSIEDYERYEDLKNTVNRLGEEGFVSFDTKEELREWQDRARENALSPEQYVNRAELEALKLQSNVMGNYIMSEEPEKADKNVLGRDLSREENPLGITKTYSFNTGTAFNSPLEYQRIDGVPTVDEEAQIGGFGEYQLIGSDQVFSDPSGVSKAIGTGLDILSVIYPPLASVFQGGKVLLEGGEIGDALTAGATIYVGGELTKELSGFTEDLLSGADIDLSSLPDPVKQTVVDTTAGIISGQDPDEAFTNSLTNQATDYATDWAAGEIESVTGDLGQDLKAFLGLPEDYEMPEPLQNIMDETTTALVQGDSATEAMESAAKGEIKDVIGDFAEDTTKELLSGAEELLGDGLAAFDETFIQPIIEPVKPILGAVEEGVKAVGRTVDEEVIQPLIEPVKPILTDIEEGIKTAGRTVDKEVIQPILEPVKSVVTAIDEALPHGTTPELPEGPNVDADLPSPDIDDEQPESKVAGLFDKELREIYKHDIYELPKLFSDEKIQGMLSRKYRV